jgi:eukaryotic-like serine/threonine-protein kinase
VASNNKRHNEECLLESIASADENPTSKPVRCSYAAYERRRKSHELPYTSLEKGEQVSVCETETSVLETGSHVMAGGHDYRVCALLGSGASAHIYLLEDASAQQRAIKVLKAAAASPSRIERFEREGRLLCMLSHPHLLKGYARGTLSSEKSQPSHYILTEYVAGTTLEHHRISTPDVRPALRIVSALLEALNYLHLDGRVSAHRDLKPANIMVSTSGQVKLLDLGIAKTHLNLRMELETQMAGTWRYMAPEQFADARCVDIRCDLYALGVILYEMLREADRPPLSGRAFMAERFSRPCLILDETQHAHWQGSDAGHRALDQLIRRLTATELGARYQSPHEAMNDLAQVIALMDPATTDTDCVNAGSCYAQAINPSIDRAARDPTAEAQQQRIRVLRRALCALGSGVLLVGVNLAYALYAPALVEWFSRFMA